MISVLETEQLCYYNMTALANLVWAVLHILLQQWNHNIVNQKKKKKEIHICE